MVTRVLAPGYEATEPSTREPCQVWRQEDEERRRGGIITFLSPFAREADVHSDILGDPRKVPFNSYPLHFHSEQSCKLKMGECAAVEKSRYCFPLSLSPRSPGHRQMIKTRVRGHFHPLHGPRPHFHPQFQNISNHIVNQCNESELMISLQLSLSSLKCCQLEASLCFELS